MCGITGAVWTDPAGAITPDELDRMTSVLAHRGPDDQRTWWSQPTGPARAAFGHRRLSIIDVAGGRQPLFNEERDVVCLMNGEIYNFKELRKELEARGHRFRTGSDGEMLVHLYEEMEERLVERLIGMYAFAIFDLRGEVPRMVLGRVRLGIKPLYYAETEEGLYFGSETKAVLESGRVSREMAPEPLLDYLVQGYVGGPQSAWAGIRRLPPSGVLVWEPGKPLQVERSWDLPVDGLQRQRTGGDGQPAGGRAAVGWARDERARGPRSRGHRRRHRIRWAGDRHVPAGDGHRGLRVARAARLHGGDVVPEHVPGGAGRRAVPVVLTVEGAIRLVADVRGAERAS